MVMFSFQITFYMELEQETRLPLENLKGETDRSAQFKTVIALYLNGDLKTFTGICKGEITHEKHGTKGFGYDPIFRAKGYTKTFAEISLDEKKSHMGRKLPFGWISCVSVPLCVLISNSSQPFLTSQKGVTSSQRDQ